MNITTGPIIKTGHFNRSRRLIAAACMALTLGSSSLFAAPSDGQSALNTYIAANPAIFGTLKGGGAKSVTTVTPAQLAIAVDAVIKQNTVVPEDVAAGALLSRPDRSKIAPQIMITAIAALGGNPNDNTVANITDAVVTLNSSDSTKKTTLTIAAQATVTQVALLLDPGAASEVGTKLANDTNFKTVLTSAKGTFDLAAFIGAAVPLQPLPGKTVADQANQKRTFVNEFVSKILSNTANLTLPPATTTQTAKQVLTTNVIAKLKSNYNVAANVSFAIANQLATSEAERIQIGVAALKAAPTASSQIARALAATIPPSGSSGPGSEAARANFAAEIVKQLPTQASTIAQGLAFLDPDFADDFTDAILRAADNLPTGTVQEQRLKTSLTASLRGAAPKIATLVSQVLDSDPEEIAEVAGKFGKLIGENKLTVASATTIASSLVKGTPRLITPEHAIDLAGIASELVLGLSNRSDFLTSSNTVNPTILNAIISVSKTVASLTKNAVFTDEEGNLRYFATEIAGSVAEVFRFNNKLTGANLDSVIAKITTAIQSATNPAGVYNLIADQQIASATAEAKANPNAFQVGAIIEVETPVTNF